VKALPVGELAVCLGLALITVVIIGAVKIVGADLQATFASVATALGG
jgi:Flp pilus assembly pilin Flp